MEVVGAVYDIPHGGRRTIGPAVYRENRGRARDLLRHGEHSTTWDHYLDIDATDRTAGIDEGGRATAP